MTLSLVLIQIHQLLYNKRFKQKTFKTIQTIVFELTKVFDDSVHSLGFELSNKTYYVYYMSTDVGQQTAAHKLITIYGIAVHSLSEK